MNTWPLNRLSTCCVPGIPVMTFIPGLNRLYITCYRSERFRELAPGGGFHSFDLRLGGTAVSQVANTCGEAMVIAPSGKRGSLPSLFRYQRLFMGWFSWDMKLLGCFTFFYPLKESDPPKRQTCEPPRFVYWKLLLMQFQGSKKVCLTSSSISLFLELGLQGDGGIRW